MAFSLGKIVLVISLTILEFFGTYGAAYIEIQPQQFSDVLPEDVKISCRPEGLEKKARQILMIQIYGKDEKPIAQIYPSFKESKLQKSSNAKFETTGLIDNDISLSNLNVTLLKPGKQWAGTYTCKVHYVDQKGMVKHDSADGELTVSKTDPAILEHIIKPLMKKISDVETKATFLQGETQLLKKKTTTLENETKFLKKKTETLENETVFLKRKTESLETEKMSLEKETVSLRRKISILEKTTESVEKEVSKIETLESSVTEKVTSFGQTNNDHLKNIQSLVKKCSLLDTKYDKKYTELQLQMNGLANKTSQTDLEDRVAALENSRRQAMTNRNADKASMSLLTSRVGTLEQREQDHSKQLKILVNKASAVESSLKKTDQKLSEEVLNRLADKASLTSVLKRLTSLGQETKDQSKSIIALENQGSDIENNLQETNKKISQEVASRLSDKAVVTSHIKKFTDLKEKTDGQIKQIEALVKKDDMLDSKLGKHYKVLEKQMDGLADKASMSSIGTRVALLEKTTKQEKSGRSSDKDSMFSLTKRVGTLERLGQDHSSQMKSLVDKDSAIETSLGITNEKLNQNVASRLKDERSLLSTIKKVNTLQKTDGDHSKLILALKTKDSQTEKSLHDTNKKLSQEVTNRLSDKATVTSNVRKVNSLELRTGNQAKQIKSLTDKSVTVDSRLSSIDTRDAKLSKDMKVLSDKSMSVDRRLSSIDTRDAKQSKYIKILSDQFKKSVTPALKSLKALQQSNGRLSSQLIDLKQNDSSMGKRISYLEGKHTKCKSVFGFGCKD